MARKRARFLTLLLIGLILPLFFDLQAFQPWQPSTIEEADRLFEEKNYRDAATLYTRLVGGAMDEASRRRASERIVTCRLYLKLYDEALEAAREHVIRCKDTIYEARAERLLGNLFLLVPHYGTRAGGKFLRAEWTQGIHVVSYRHDKKEAIEHLERARELYALHDGNKESLAALPGKERVRFHVERIECLFDLANVCSRFGIYEREWHYWYAFWGERDDFLAETAGENDFDEYDSLWRLQRTRPTGLRLGKDGKPVFPAEPDRYSPLLADDEKILFLLNEIRDLDRTENSKFKAQSLYRQAMLARARFGMDRLRLYANSYYLQARHPLSEELEKQNPWELGDDEALVLAGGRIHRVTLPEQYDVLRMLRFVAGDLRSSGIADQANFAVGLHYQTRQQYKEALDQYIHLSKVTSRKSQWFKKSQVESERIRTEQVKISDTGVQLPGEAAKIEVSYRNLERLWFTARPVDLNGFFEAMRAGLMKEESKAQHLWQLTDWSQFFTTKGSSRQYDYWIRELAARFTGSVTARWSDRVKDDGTHRYAHQTIRTPIEECGAYLVSCYTDEPPAKVADLEGTEVLGLGASRAVLVVTDLALVEKRTGKGNLFFIADARTGAPVKGADLSIMESWSTWDSERRKSDNHFRIEKLASDRSGTAVFPSPKTRHSRLHVIASRGKRLAWTGMAYARRYHPSAVKKGKSAYVITDRPVYRPGQTVYFKAWIRETKDGILQNYPGKNATLYIHDMRGNEVYKTKVQTDPHGAIDGSFTLGEEPPLGVYRISISDVVLSSGRNFRVEEYKKPEFEVLVETGENHMKLGETASAVIRANYFFGAPVTDAQVKYKVFREEYRHGYYFPGEWDWLYGPGYGRCWYSCDWFPWWSRVRCCWMPPWWWWSWQVGALANPVRELVQQGETAIGPEGTVEVAIDTEAALRNHPDCDHRYVIEAEVRDTSRRVITGQGSIKVTRQAFYSFIRSDKSFYSPGEEMQISLSCLTPGEKPVKADGIVTISEIVFGGPENARIEEKELDRFKIETDESGRASFRFRHERSGQLKIRFETPDAWGGSVNGYALVWICGSDFDGRLHRFNDLEILTDKRTYKPGETCHLMINTRRPGSTILFADEVDGNCLLSWRLLHLPKKSMMLEIPMTKAHCPNFFVEAVTVADGRVFQQAKRICVPPEDGMLDVEVTTDRDEYGPGEKARVTVRATDREGKPARAQICLSAFDRSILYIQEEYTPGIRKFFHGRVRRHSPWMNTNLFERFRAQGYVLRPFESYSAPPDWWGVWGATAGRWGEEAINSLGFAYEYEEDGAIALPQKEGFLGGNGRSRYALGLKDSVSKSAVDGPSGPSTAGGIAGPAGPQAGPLKEATIRQKFADTALWQTTLLTDASGTAVAEFEMPENLTTWKVNAWAATDETDVGQAATKALTTKDLLVRLQAPRFFMERDEVVISANIHNDLGEDKLARVALEIPEGLLELLDGFPAIVDVTVPSGGARRVDWRVKVLGEGRAPITVKAQTDEESDAMKMTFPVLVHGMVRQVATTGSIRPREENASRTVEVVVPEERRPELSRLEVRFTPSLVGAMLDALPYCIDYPYGCTEQTVSRFLPAVLTLKTIRNMGVTLEELRSIRGRMEEIRRIEKGERRQIYCHIDNPVFDSAEMKEIIDDGLERIANMQHDDGGWSWWKRGESNSYLTSYVLQALCAAQENDVKVKDVLIGKGFKFLKSRVETEMKKSHWAVHAQHAFSFYVLSLRNKRAVIEPGEDDSRPGDLADRLFAGRDRLNLYGKALLALGLANLDDGKRARRVLGNIMQYREENIETGTAWFRTPEHGWWYWWNSDVETNAWCLRAIVRLDPQSETAPRLVRWLLENRRNGYYWRSTRDTTLCVAAMSEFVDATGEAQPDYTLTFDFDSGKVVKKVKVTRESFFTGDNRFVLEGAALTGGRHLLRITKEGRGAIYWSTYLSYFTMEEGIKAAGHRLKLKRSYFKLVQIPYETTVEGSAREKVIEKRLRYKRVPVKDGDPVQSGDLIQVELRVTADNNYTYLCFEDMKPAGCEAVDVRSGGKGQEGFYSYMEIRDEKVAFFVQNIEQGEHLLRYRLRAEIPGKFHALPARLYGMYVPELKANSSETTIAIRD